MRLRIATSFRPLQTTVFPAEFDDEFFANCLNCANEISKLMTLGRVTVRWLRIFLAICNGKQKTNIFWQSVWFVSCCRLTIPFPARASAPFGRRTVHQNGRLLFRRPNQILVSSRFDFAKFRRNQLSFTFHYAVTYAGSRCHATHGRPHALARRRQKRSIGPPLDRPKPQAQRPNTRASVSSGRHRPALVSPRHHHRRRCTA